MKSVNVDNRLLDRDLILAAIKKVCKGKQKKNGKLTRKYMQARAILADPEPWVETVYTAVAQFQRKQHDLHTGNADIQGYAGAFAPHPYRSFELVCDNGKQRRITAASSFIDQFVHQLVAMAGLEAARKSLYPYCCGSVPGRGPHQAVKRIRRYVQHHAHMGRSGIKYVAQLDVRKCFPSVSHAALKAMLHKRFKGHLFLDLCDCIIDSYCEPGTEGDPRGLPIGFVTSPFFCNLLLTPIDHMVAQEYDGRCYTRYVDDITFFGSSKKQLHKTVRAIMAATEPLGLKIKDNWQVFRFDYIDPSGNRRGRALDTLGFRFFRDHTRLRKRSALKIMRQARRYKGKHRVSAHNAASLLSKLGALRHCNSKSFWYKHVKPYIRIKRLKEAIANENREQSNPGARGCNAAAFGQRRGNTNREHP